LIAILRRSRLARRVVDRPNERSLHTTPTPRVGGIGLLAASLPAAAWAAADSLGVVLACAAALALLSFADDLSSLPIEVRLPGHAVAASVAVLALAGPGAHFAGLGIAEALAAVVALVWMANLFNFMDGADGLAGLMATIGFGALATGAWLAGDMEFAAASAAIAAASAGFLAHNFPPARVFLGDAGSVPLGFLAGALGGYGAMLGLWPLWFPIIVFSPFIFDASVTVLRRLVRGEHIWIAHRTHYYQRLVLAGWSHRRLALAAGALMLAAAGSALAALRCDATGHWSIIFTWATAYALLAAVLERRLSNA
jgi:UDP-N-acetylmuramyl pentapeptide phosphotransferase/UDP-N-acetylglucosamine-1-phosphate transferase